MTDSIWDDADLKSSDDFVKFDHIGDTVTGRIINIRKHVFDDKSVAAQILLDCDGTERTLTAGQMRLKAALAEQRPQAGDTLTVTMTQVEKRAGGKTLKHFEVVVAPQGGSPVAPTAAAVPAPAAPAASVPPAASTTDAAALLTSMSPEQLEAMKSMGFTAPVSA